MANLSHLDELEAEAIYIIREVAAECEKPVMLYSIGKDSSVMLHLAMKAFYPEKPPFPFLSVPILPSSTPSNCFTSLPMIKVTTARKRAVRFSMGTSRSS